MARGEMFVLSAPSGAGKTTLIKRMFEVYPSVQGTLAFAVSHTTRPPRPGEVDGGDYHFVDRQTFEAMVEDDAFLEWAVVHGHHLYGTSHGAVDRLLEQGKDVLLDIDVQGAEQVWQRHPDVPTLFIMPPSFEALEERLQSRGSEAPEQIARRLATARDEVRKYRRYEYVIVNDQLERACEALAAIFLARRSRRQRRESELEAIVEQFPPPP